MFESLDLGTIITIIISGIATFAGGFWLRAKGKIKLIINLLREGFELIDNLEKALGDDKITKAEIEELKADAARVKTAWKALSQKEV